MTKISDEALNRAADLHYAYQHGQDAAKGDATAEPEFRQKFAGDAEAEHEYQRGLAEQYARTFSLEDPPEYRIDRATQTGTNWRPDPGQINEPSEYPWPLTTSMPIFRG